MSTEQQIESEIVDTNKFDEQKQEYEIPAANVRSGLASLEVQATKIIQHLEQLKRSDSENSQSVFTVPGFLNVEQKKPSEILVNLENLIINSHSDSESDDDSSDFILPPLDEVSNLALISNSIVAYISHLERHRLVKITSKIITDTNRWLSHVFRFIDSSVSYHCDLTESILRAVRLAIVSRCPGYLEGGVMALASPCLYISEQNSAISLQYACRQIGLPLESIRLVPCNTTVGASQNTIDISALQKMIATDISANRTPLFVMADLGASVCGSVDNINRLYDICKVNEVWLHCRGHSLAALALTQGTGNTNAIADSMSLTLGGWLGIPTLPIVLLHRQVQNVALSVFETDPLKSRRLSSLTLWTTLQALGYDVMFEKILFAFESCRVVYEIVSKFDGIKILSKIPGGCTVDNETTHIAPSIKNLINKPLNASILFESAVVVVAFQFDGNFLVEEQENENNNEIPMNYKKIDKKSNASYFDKLNSWLGQILIRDCPQLVLEIVEHPTYGVFLRYCPFELGLGETVPSMESLESFAASLETQTEILKATVKHKATLNALVEKSDVLRLVPLPNWAGLGGVRFVPDGWETLLTDQAKTELNKLNSDLVEALKSTDNAFSLGEGPDGLTCVRFGMVTQETDVEELLDLVIAVGRKVQENSKVLDSMTEIVKKGIEAATADLQRESEEKLWQDGILRHVPVFGNLMNWWSPPPKESGIKGRSLNLTQGVIESTENIYKYHMQIAGGSSQLPGNKIPPAPMVQTAISGHSRSVSQSSGTSTNAEVS